MAKPNKPPVFLIAGPTASGKSALALSFARHIDGVIVNADSAQVYRDLPILSAAPTSQDFASAEHRLYGVRDGASPCSAADWAAIAKKEINHIHAGGGIPIMVGGTGLYLRTLLEGIAPVPAIDARVREQVRAVPVADNYARLKKLDPAAAERLHAADTTRIARALEVVMSTGRTLAEWQRERGGGIKDKICLRPLILLPPRDWLYARCDERFAAMVDHGAVDEVRALIERKLDPSLPVMNAIGVPQIAAYLGGEMSLEDAIAAGQQATRRYAKRQYTWFAHQPPPEWPRLHQPVDAAPVDALSFFDQESR